MSRVVESGRKRVVKIDGAVLDSSTQEARGDTEVQIVERLDMTRGVQPADTNEESIGCRQPRREIDANREIKIKSRGQIEVGGSVHFQTDAAGVCPEIDGNRRVFGGTQIEIQQQNALGRRRGHRGKGP